MPETDDDDAESFAAFMKYLDKATGSKEWLEKVKGSLSSGAAAISQAPGNMTEFLAKQLEKMEKAQELTQAQLATALDLLTPEQRTLVRSAGKSAGSSPGENGPKPGETQQQQNETQPAPAPAKKKRPWI